MLKRRHFSAAIALGAATLGFPSVHGQVKPEPVKVTIAVGGKAAFHYLPLTIADRLGYFRAEGLAVEVVDHAGASRALQSVMGGTADVVSGSYEQTIALQQKGQWFQAFVLQGRTPQIAMGVSVKNLPDYTHVADLRGRKIGVSAPGASSNVAASMVLARAGLKASDVSFIGVGTAAGALASLRAGQVDAMCNIDPVMTLLEQKGDVRIICDTRTVQGTLDLFGGPMPSACLYAPLEFVQKNPNTCQALANGMVHALKWLRHVGSADLLKIVPESHLLGDRALYLASFHKLREGLALDGLMPPEGAETTLRILSQFEASARTERIELSKTYTNEFARRAKERFKA